MTLTSASTTVPFESGIRVRFIPSFPSAGENETTASKRPFAELPPRHPAPKLRVTFRFLSAAWAASMLSTLALGFSPTPPVCRRVPVQPMASHARAGELGMNFGRRAFLGSAAAASLLSATPALAKIDSINPANNYYFPMARKPVISVRERLVALANSEGRLKACGAVRCGAVRCGEGGGGQWAVGLRAATISSGP